MDVKGTVLRGL